MEKITKEELMKRLNLTEEEMQKVVGGKVWPSWEACRANCEKVHEVNEQECINSPYWEDRYEQCVTEAKAYWQTCRLYCDDYEK